MRHLLLVVAIGLSITSCSRPAAQDENAAESVTPTVSGPNDVGASFPAAPMSPTDHATSDAAALELATRALTAYARPDVPEGEWIADLRPYLTDTAAQSYAYVDPVEVPARAVTGAGTLPADQSAFLATVVLPTDVGFYELLLVRDGAGDPWLVETITPPEGVGS